MICSKFRWFTQKFISKNRIIPGRLLRITFWTAAPICAEHRSWIWMLTSDPKPFNRRSSIPPLRDKISLTISLCHLEVGFTRSALPGNLRMIYVMVTCCSFLSFGELHLVRRKISGILPGRVQYLPIWTFWLSLTSGLILSGTWS